jgi:feruloyl esterase
MKISCCAHRLAAMSSLPRPTWNHFVTLTLWVLVLSMPAFSQGAAPAVSCESLAKLALPDTAITMAQSVAAGEFIMPARRGGQAPGQGAGRGSEPARGQAQPPESGRGPGQGPGAAQPSTPAFCRVAATLKPSSDSNIRIEVWLPLSGWNGKFWGEGNGGFGGSISYQGFVNAVQRGYAVAGSDAGHDSSKPGEEEGKFLLGHPEKLIDYGHRAVHLMTVRGKDVVKAFYGVPPRYSYFFGYSLGGYQSITEARRYPEDYDGISSGKPIPSFVLFNAEQLWPAWLIAKDPAKFIPESKYAMIQDAVMKKCDALDGVKDGQVTEPNHCPFDPKELLCKGADGPDCLTAPQVELMRQTYQGPIHPRTKEVIFPGPAMGGETAQFFWFADHTPRLVALDMFKYVVFKDADWDWKTLDYDKDIAKGLQVTAKDFHTDANLKAYIDRGGKIMMYIPWVDYHNGLHVAGYYEDVLKAVGADKARNSVRLIQVPCIGGSSCEAWDKVGSLEQWVENGRAPEQLLQSYLVDGKTRTRPLCAYPKVPQYKGTGDTDNAENFFCAESKFAKK